jgi:hypothetical protein
MLKEGGRENNPEFQMHHEDFPALPGAEGGASLPGNYLGYSRMKLAGKWKWLRFFRH